ncbi:MAG: hypothetical protein ACE365_04575 [Gammaproteobacteria bacterium]
MYVFLYIKWLSDAGLAEVELRYLRNKQKHEIDFLLIKDKKPWLPIEVKLNETTASKNWAFYLKHLSCKQGLQIVKQPGVYKLLALPQGEVLIISTEYVLPHLV